MTASEQMNVDLDAEVASILRSYAAEAHVSEGEIVNRAIRAYDLRSVVARIRARSDLDEDEAMALVREELRAVHSARDAANCPWRSSYRASSPSVWADSIATRNPVTSGSRSSGGMRL